MYVLLEKLIEISSLPDDNPSYQGEQEHLNDQMILLMNESFENIPIAAFSLLTLVQEISIQGNEYLKMLMAKFVDKEKQALIEKQTHKSVVGENLSTEHLGSNEKMRILDDKIQGIKATKLEKKFITKSKDTQVKQRAFFIAFLELCLSENETLKKRRNSIKSLKSSSLKEEQKGAQELNEKAYELYGFLIERNSDFLVKWLIPNLKAQCSLKLTTVFL